MRKYQFLIQGIKIVTSRLGRYIGLLLILMCVISSCSFNQKVKKGVYIYFEDGLDGMYKMKESGLDSSFLYTIDLNRNFWYGFKPIGKVQNKSSEVFFKDQNVELRDINWLRHLVEFYPDSLRGKENIFIVEELHEDRIQLTPTKHFVAID